MSQPAREALEWALRLMDAGWDGDATTTGMRPEPMVQRITIELTLRKEQGKKP